MKIRNISARDLEVTPDDGPPFSVAAGETVDVADELGQRMSEQADNWKPTTTTKTKEN